MQTFPIFGNVMDDQLPELNEKITKRRTKHKKNPPVAQRFNMMIKRDGVPIQIKARWRMDQMNDLSCTSHFTSFSKTDSEVLAKIAKHSGVVLDESESEISANIDFLKAKEIAHALLCVSKQKTNDKQNVLLTKDVVEDDILDSTILVGDVG
ncbi:hypothetical protein GUJ93_ZPchr0010g7913 [Zizania palustris]|uniref:Uncharacterized protein n=1 Tax=Zizania palustris TaxID=103762 RepID=A0A8J6BRL0_ZIZPA|nr:hypothetical protein GUJ93_ZPchr0010g7913 [Zizania palustris]